LRSLLNAISKPTGQQSVRIHSCSAAQPDLIVDECLLRARPKHRKVSGLETSINSSLLQAFGGFLSLTSGFILICVLNRGSSVYMSVTVALGVSGVTLCIIGIRLLLIATEEDGLRIEVEWAFA
jgi:hypothetical protein